MTDIVKDILKNPTIYFLWSLRGADDSAFKDDLFSFYDEETVTVHDRCLARDHLLLAMVERCEVLMKEVGVVLHHLLEIVLCLRAYVVSRMICAFL